MKRAILITWIVLATSSVLVPVALPFAVALLQTAHVRVWLRGGSGEWNHHGNSIAVQVPDGSGFRSIVELQGWVAFVLFTATPCASMIWLQTKSKRREKPLLGALWALFVMWFGWITLLTMFDYAKLAFATVGAVSIASAMVISIIRAGARIPRRRRQKRVNRGLCARGGYNLTGNVSGVCPECGSKIDLADAPAPAIPWPAITDLRKEESEKSEQAVVHPESHLANR